ncbi:putative MPP superfamily phosphohydrolase [Streptosporangium lutulentum]|uniref:MPP superfamily phosphohydrolase n=1 Tax=Streptosporangium lutulentum TaxID=1461250 RepID=A0ABT9QN44_9ACTN|nr:metallophosphoesterase [Streptosporangium lutulentum]MDP9848158.1 putative MPP superfamily phosphohydrolase [Streptosporangium lutulentum]
MVGFVALVLGVVALVHYYLWHRLIRSTTRPGRIRRVLTWILVGLGVLAPVTLIGSRSEWGHSLAWPGFFWLAVMFYLFVFLLVLEIPRALAVLTLGVVERGAGRWNPSAVVARRMARTAALADQSAPAGQSVRADQPLPAEQPVPVAHAGRPAEGSEAGPDLMGRRLFIARTAAVVAGAGALTAVGTGIRTALGDPVIESVKVTLPKLDSRLSGLRFAVVSDIHLGPLTGTRHTERIVRMINSLEADVVAVVGDLVDGTVAELGPLARPLRSLESRYGAYFVTGNHEYYTANGPQEWIEELRGLGIRPLGNERVEIAHAGAVLDLAGVNDVNGAASGDGPDFERALGGRDRSRSTVLLAHQPVQVVEAARYGVDLQLSGHTHGGQMVPFNLVIPLQQPMVSGLGEMDGTQVYVTRGAGFWGPPVRVGSSPEITLLEIQN